MSNYNEVRQSFSIQAEKFATRGNYSCSGKSSKLDGSDIARIGRELFI